MSNLFNTAVSNLVTSQKRSGSVGSSLASFFNFSLTESGKKINSHSALTISAFYSGVTTIANSIALLPMAVYRKNGAIREHVGDHPADFLLGKEPNSHMTAFNFKFIMALAVLMKGNAYALIERDAAGKPVAYIFMEEVEVFKYNNKLFYRWENKMYSADDVIHIPGFSFDGITGKAVLHHAADNLGVALTAQQFGSESLADRGISQGVIETEKEVNPEAKKRISNAWSAAMSSGNKHRAAILDEGFKYRALALSPSEAKFIETYAAGIEDIGRWLNIPNFKLNIKGEGGYNFIIEMSNEYLQRAVMPHAEKFKQEFERKTFTTVEKKAGLYILLKYKKLLQANPEKRAAFYKEMYYIGVYSPNDIRALEDENPRTDPWGDQYVQATNQANQDQLQKQLSEPSKTNTPTT